MKQTPTIFEFSDAIQDPKKKTDLDSIKNPYSKTTTQPKTLCFGWRVLNSLKNFKATSINITIQDLNSLKPKFNSIKTKRQSEFQGSEYIEIQETKKRKWKTRMLKMKEERERERDYLADLGVGGSGSVDSIVFSGVLGINDAFLV